jgi:hypothetical protein
MTVAPVDATISGSENKKDTAFRSEIRISSLVPTHFAFLALVVFATVKPLETPSRRHNSPPPTSALAKSPILFNPVRGLSNHLQ